MTQPFKGVWPLNVTLNTYGGRVGHSYNNNLHVCAHQRAHTDIGTVTTTEGFQEMLIFFF